MLLRISTVIFVFSFISALICGRSDDVVSSFFSGGTDVFSYCFKIGGSICLFSGFLKVAEDSGLISVVANLFHPFVKIFMPSALVTEETENAVVMNISSNLFGLGNAATPFGIKAAKNIYSLNGLSQPDRSLASFIVLNTSSLCINPINPPVKFAFDCPTVALLNKL